MKNDRTCIHCGVVFALDGDLLATDERIKARFGADRGVKVCPLCVLASIMDIGAHCRICEAVAELPCPECVACFACAQDDCGTCLLRLDFLRLEQEAADRATGKRGRR